MVGLLRISYLLLIALPFCFVSSNLNQLNLDFLRTSEYGEKPLFEYYQTNSDQVMLPTKLNELQYHGTTTLAFVFGDSVIVAVDSMASVGSYVGSRTVRKVFPMSSHIVATMAGGAADCAFWIRKIACEAKILEFEYGNKPEVGMYAKLLSQTLREYRGMDISVGTMVAGWHHNTGPSLYYVDSQGVCVNGKMFSVGSGSSLAYSVIDSAWNDLQKNYTLTQALDLATWAVRHATYRDSYSGGYINIIQLNVTGIHHLKRIDSRSLPVN